MFCGGSAYESSARVPFFSQLGYRHFLVYPAQLPDKRGGFYFFKGSMKLRFPIEQLSSLADQYGDIAGERDRRLGEQVTNEVFPAYLRDGHLTKEGFLIVCAWKTPRCKPHCESNDAAMIKEVSALALTTQSERLKIQVWTLLAGVKWPTASVFLHFAFPHRYPILDFRALWSLETKVPAQYNFRFWLEYARFCRSLSIETGFNMRVVDKALWTYSKLHQPR
jgi:hypothetical protein